MNEHIKYIENLTLKALESINCEDPPVPIEKVAKKFDLTVVEFDFSDTISGVLKTQKKVIGVNRKHHPIRRRFTVAHELGHFLLGHELNKGGDLIDDNFEKPVSSEREANLFASFLLMPKEWIKKRAKKQKINSRTIKDLSKEFKVSEQALTIRLLELNLIK